VTDPADKDHPRRGRQGRARYGATSADQRLSRPLLIALVSVVVGAAILFWPRGGGLRLGANDPVHVVRVDTTVAAPAPRSGDVDVATARRPLVAEAPNRERTADSERPLTITSRIEPGEVVTPPSPGPTSVAPPASAAPPAESAPPAEAAPIAESAPPIVEPAPIAQPAEEGAYALQVASFESDLGAQTLRDGLLDKGYPVHIRAASTANGGMVYRVWVGYFQNREAAAAYADANQKALAGATPVHR